MNKADNQIKPTKRIKRIAAAVIDTSLALVCIFVMSLPLIIISMKNLAITESSIGIIAISMLTGAMAAILCLVYEILLPFIWLGQSIGMRLLRIQIVDEKGELLKLRQLVIRAITVVFTFITSCGISLIAEIFIVAFSVDHRSFNDTVSRIYIVDYKKKPAEKAGKPTKEE